MEDEDWVEVRVDGVGLGGRCREVDGEWGEFLVHEERIEARRSEASTLVGADGCGDLGMARKSKTERRRRWMYVIAWICKLYDESVARSFGVCTQRK